MAPGTYVLIIEVPKDVTFFVGSLGEIKIKKGALLYVGSGLNGVEKRIMRHFRREKKRHWHIDYITSILQPKIAVYIVDERKLEDAVAKELLSNHHLTPILGFGATDSKLSTHLFWGENVDILLTIASNILEKIGGKKPRMFFAKHFPENR